MINLERKDWIRALTAHPVDLLNTLAEQLATDCEVKLTSLPQAGLGLLQLADGAFHEPYYLGEFPLSACRLELVLPDGRRAEGGAQVVADDADLARSLAILDAIVEARLPGWEMVAEQVTSGARKRSESDQRRNAILAATRVDFSMLNNTGDDDEN
ncbi:MAG: phosphonate C-P lyase system protein PhnG [Rhodoferax ferrireducens]|uniref:Phosphonate C-P lyase system protein PhnG n=2 Tax=Pseudomonadota TaxID=1224 RepID=A0A1Y1QS11_9GAMM|nr:MAG: phosphonate C-P lyase system protein PhnG [Rhodoferax ferrireducens]OQX12219.1 MAG: phosphonate C-P lyase system protein PhnG [Thiothrix lacustris]